MDKQMIERLAREAGIDPSDEYPIDAGNWVATPADLASFAALIAEECANACDEVRSADDNLRGQDAAQDCADAIRAKVLAVGAAPGRHPAAVDPRR